MTMHLEGPWLSTTRTKTKSKTLTKSGREELERQWRERNIRLKQMGLTKESFEQFLEFAYGRGKKMARQKTENGSKNSETSPKINKTTEEKCNLTHIAISDSSKNVLCDKKIEDKVVHGKIWVTGPCSTKSSPVYTGTKVVGIGTMHKSNAVPIFSDDEAKEISSMRR